MFLKEIFIGLVQHREFIFFNTGVHVLFALLLASSIFPFLSNKLRARYNYFFVVFFPALFGSLFPDLMFIISTWVKERSLNGLFYLLSHGGDIYNSFHFAFPIILVVPTTVFLVFVFNKILRHKFDDFPKWSFLLICVISLFCALFHVFMDSVGF